MFADGAFLQAVRLSELAHRLAIFPRAQPEHQFLPHRFRQRLTAMKHLIGAQPNFFLVGRPHTRPVNRHLLAHYHAIASLLAPTVGRPIRLRLAAFPNQIPHLFLHQQLHQLQACLANQCADTLAQPTHHLGHRQHHLHCRISIRSHFLEPFYSSLRFNLIWFLHSDSPFSRERKLLLAYQGFERRVATFYDLAGVSSGTSATPHTHSKAHRPIAHRYHRPTPGDRGALPRPESRKRSSGPGRGRNKVEAPTHESLAEWYS